MIYTVKAGDTAGSIAELLTIGGKAYGPAILELNNLDSLAGYPAGNTLIIPDEWLKTHVPTKVMPRIFGVEAKSLVLVGGLGLALLIFLGKK